MPHAACTCQMPSQAQQATNSCAVGGGSEHLSYSTKKLAVPAKLSKLGHVELTSGAERGSDLIG